MIRTPDVAVPGRFDVTCHELERIRANRPSSNTDRATHFVSNSRVGNPSLLGIEVLIWLLNEAFSLTIYCGFGRVKDKADSW